MRYCSFAVLASLALSLLTNCASIVSGGQKALPIMSQPDEAIVEVVNVNTGSTVAKAKTPYTAMLSRDDGYFSKARYNVKISKENFLPREQRIEAGVNGWYWGNIIFGGLIGLLIVDPATGAMWKIGEENVNLKLYSDSPEGKKSMAQEMNEKSVALCKDGSYDEAVEAANQAISLYPEYAEAYCARAKAYSGKEDYNKAMEDLNKAVSIKPDFGEALFERGNVYQKQNNLDSAKADMKVACDMSYKSACDHKF